MPQYFKTQPLALFSNCTVPEGSFWEADLHLLPFYLKHLSSFSYFSIKLQGLSKALEAQPGLPVLASLLASSTTLPFHSLIHSHFSPPASLTVLCHRQHILTAWDVLPLLCLANITCAQWKHQCLQKSWQPGQNTLWQTLNLWPALRW